MHAILRAPMNFVVLSSSRGTVFEATLAALKAKTLTANFLGLIADRSDHGCVEKAEKAGVPAVIVEKKKGEDREAYDKRLAVAISSLGGDQDTIIACQGWMWLLSPWFVKKWHGKILNVHPSLLPKYPGTNAHELVLKAKEKESGMTIHLIDEGLDSGKILLQKTCPVLPGDTEQTLKARVQALECEWYPRVLEMIEQGEMKI